MSARAQLLAYGGTLPAGETVVYTVPTNVTAILKVITLHNSSGATVTTNVRLPSAAGVLVRAAWSLLTNGSDLWKPDFVLEAGQQLLLTPSTLGAIRYSVHGSELYAGA